MRSFPLATFIGLSVISYKIAFAQPVMPAESIDLYENISSLLDGVQPWITDADSRSSALSQETIGAPDVVSELEWSGERGYLFHVRVEKNDATGITAVIGKPVPFGAGRIPSEVIAANISKPSLLPSPRSGFQYSVDDSFYIWATLSPTQSGHLQFGITPPSLSLIIEREGLTIVREKSLLESINTESYGRVLQGVAEHLKEIAADDTQRAKYAQAVGKAQEFRKQAIEIENNLTQALNKIQEAEQFNTYLTTLQNVIGIGILAGQAEAQFADGGTQFKEAPDAKTLLKEVEDYKTEKDGYVIREHHELEVTSKNSSEADAHLIDILNTAHAPPEVINILGTPMPVIQQQH